MIRPFAKTATLTPQTIDVATGDHTAGTPVDVDGCAWWETPGTETTGGQDTVVYDVTLLLPPGTEIAPTTRVTLDGNDFAVVGQPIAWQSSLTGWEPDVEVHLRRVIG